MNYDHTRFHLFLINLITHFKKCLIYSDIREAALYFYIKCSGKPSITCVKRQVYNYKLTRNELISDWHSVGRKILETQTVLCVFRQKKAQLPFSKHLDWDSPC